MVFTNKNRAIENKPLTSNDQKLKPTHTHTCARIWTNNGRWLHDPSYLGVALRPCDLSRETWKSNHQPGAPCCHPTQDPKHHAWLTTMKSNKKGNEEIAHVWNYQPDVFQIPLKKNLVCFSVQVVASALWYTPSISEHCPWTSFFLKTRLSLAQDAKLVDQRWFGDRKFPALANLWQLRCKKWGKFVQDSYFTQIHWTSSRSIYMYLCTNLCTILCF